MTNERIIELLEIEMECVRRNGCGECNRACHICDLLQDDTELHEMYAEVIARMKAQESRVMTLDEVKAIKSCWIEDEEAGIVYPAIYECRGNPSKKGQYAVFVIKPDSDVLPEDCDDDIVDEFEDGNRWLWEANINRTWRPWTSRPDEKRRAETPWDC